jgi:hypothetical protein
MTNNVSVSKTGWLIANGDTQRLEVLRSPLVTSTKPIYQPVRQFIADHGLLLASQETFPNIDWMFGEVEMSVYLPPASRNASYAAVSA